MNNASLQDAVLSRKQAAEFLGICKTTLDRTGHTHDKSPAQGSLPAVGSHAMA